MLMRDEKLAQLRTQFDGRSHARLLRGEQDEKSASIGMRKCGRMRDEGRA